MKPKQPPAGPRRPSRDMFRPIRPAETRVPPGERLPSEEYLHEASKPTNPRARALFDAQRDLGFIRTIQARCLDPVVSIAQSNDRSMPQVTVRVPDDWPSVILAPFYDVHIGAGTHDARLFAEHRAWVRDTPNVLTWNGGDLVEMATKVSPGAGVYTQRMQPAEQLRQALDVWSEVAHKTLFWLPGNHEGRTDVLLGFQPSEWMASILNVPYFPDYALCRISWRDRHFNLLAHHGSGAAQTAGARLNNIRKELSWAHGFDLYWVGHLHDSIAEEEVLVKWNHRLGCFEKSEAYVIMSPSYMDFPGSYAALKRLKPTVVGMVAVELRENGRMDLSKHAHGDRD